MRRRTTSKPKPQKLDEHQCISHREGDWVIFICPVCRDYQRNINFVTKEVVVHRGTTMAIHVGSHTPFVTSLSGFSIN